MSEHQANLTKIQETTTSYNLQLPKNLEKFGDTFEHSKKPESSFQNQLRKNASLDQEDVRKTVSPKTKYTKGISKKLNKKELPSFKVRQRPLASASKVQIVLDLAVDPFH